MQVGLVASLVFGWLVLHKTWLVDVGDGVFDRVKEEKAR